MFPTLTVLDTLDQDISESRLHNAIPYFKPAYRRSCSEFLNSL